MFAIVTINITLHLTSHHFCRVVADQRREFAGLVLFASSAGVYLLNHGSNLFIFTKWTQHFFTFYLLGRHRPGIRNIYLSTLLVSNSVQNKFADGEAFRIDQTCPSQDHNLLPLVISPLRSPRREKRHFSGF